MDEKNKRIEKIYSRTKIHLPKITVFNINKRKNHYNKIKNIQVNNRIKKTIKITSILIIALGVAKLILKIIEPVIDIECLNIAKSIATRISNEQTTCAMENYEYEDITTIVKDSNNNVKMISTNTIIINKIISTIPIKIQNELNKIENSTFYIQLGTLSGSKILAGRGPKIEIKMSSTGNIETNLKSEFYDAGINQTLHRIYLEIKCNIIILTPFDRMEEQVVNQVLIAEGIIIGNIPNTYYNFQGINKEEIVDIIE